MVTKVVGQGIYAGVPYIVAEKDGERFVELRPDAARMFASKGANLRALNNIGDGDPDEAMEALFDSLPKEENS